MFEHCAVLLRQNVVLIDCKSFSRSICEVHLEKKDVRTVTRPRHSFYLGWDRAADLEVHIHVRLGGNVLEVDGGVVLVLGLAQVEGELVVDGEVVVAALVHGVAEVVVLGVALLAVVPRHPLGGAEAVPGAVVTQRALPVTLTPGKIL